MRCPEERLWSEKTRRPRSEGIPIVNGLAEENKIIEEIEKGY